MMLVIFNGADVRFQPSFPKTFTGINQRMENILIMKKLFSLLTHSGVGGNFIFYKKALLKQ